MTRYDVAVVGAGPAGASCALFLAGRNLNVLLVERERLPRKKPCGGAVPRATVEAYPFIDSIKKAFIGLSRVGYSFRNTRHCERSTGAVEVYSVERREFDYHLACEAVKRGARLVEGEAVVCVRENEGTVLIETAGGRVYTARYAALASGAFSLPAHLCFPLSHRKESLGMASVADLFPLERKLLDSYQGKVHIDFAFLRNGYGGIIPKHDRLLLCLYTRSAASRALLYRKTREFMDNLSLQGTLKDFSVTPLQVYGGRRSLARGNILLLGDAASLADPLSGEGIKHALKSGEIAAAVLSDLLEGRGSSGDYSRRIHNELGRELLIAGTFVKVAYSFPAITYGGLVNVSSEAGAVLNGTISYGDLLDRLKGRILKRLWRGRPG
ncbi:MAG: FAD-dependent oxidoreductase [Candidatus Eremiobacteraeota bacterium]|nr:FAD-dependent oxidoreductase [Candidatus Eremiobacteraeota bacterium]